MAKTKTLQPAMIIQKYKLSNYASLDYTLVSKKEKVTLSSEYEYEERCKPRHKQLTWIYLGGELVGCPRVSVCGDQMPIPQGLERIIKKLPLQVLKVMGRTK